MNAVDAMVGHARRAPEHHHVPGFEDHSPLGSCALQPADVKGCIITQRDRHHRRCAILLVLVAVRPHLRAPLVKVDEASFGRCGVGGDGIPDLEKHLRHGGPGAAGEGMGGLITVAAELVGHPAQRAAVGHPHRKRLARARHGRRVKWGSDHHLGDKPRQLGLLRRSQIARDMPEAVEAAHAYVTVAFPHRSTVLTGRQAPDSGRLGARPLQPIPAPTI
jgi:hypothetical protein